MDRLLYETSAVAYGYLIIPSVHCHVNQQPIYSYQLLSEWGHRGRFHKVENPANQYSGSVDGILMVAQDHLEHHSDIELSSDYFKRRYVYRNTLIVVFDQAGKCFYDHYPATSLNNIAAPKLFHTEHDCLAWIKQEFDRNYSDRNYSDRPVG